MAEPARPLRADAARNRARVLEVAYETFAAEGLAVPIDEIARRAGVGAGTVYRHFPTKEDLYRAVVEDRLRHIVDDGRALLANEEPGKVLFTFLRSMVLKWGATDRVLSEALAGLGIDIKAAVPEVEEEFLGLLDDLLKAAQKAGTARRDLDVRDLKALMVGAQAMQSYNADAAGRLTEVILDGLRTPG
jgi:AcrR family transcriptional regulator